jgi:membrane-associated phospholipid phosphatase
MTDSVRRACVSGVLCVTVLTAGVRPASAQSVTSLVTGTATDFRNLATRESAIWLTMGLAAVGMNQSLDHPTSDAMSASKRAGDVFAPGELIGGAKFQLAGALVTYGVGRFTGNSRVSQFGADLVRANIVAQTLTGAIKMAVQRDRPDGTEYSFPSGHTSVSFAAATVVQRHFGWRAGVPAYAAASYVAASRIQEKRHYLSDVAYGAVVGIVAGRAVTVGRGKYRFAVEPMVPAGGGAGVALTRR